MTRSGRLSDWTAPQLRRLRQLQVEYPTEVKEVAASAKQKYFQEAFFRRADPKTGRPLSQFVAMGANRSGKSIVAGWFCFAKWLRYVARNGAWLWCIGQTLDRSIGGQQKELWNALPRWMFGGQTWNEKLGFGAHRKLVLPTTDGGRCLIEFRSNDQDPSTFEQAKLDGVWADERLDEKIYDRLLPRVIDRNGWFLYSDIPEQWWQLARLKEAHADAEVHFQHMVMQDNAHNLPEGAIRKARAQMTGDEAKKRIGGEFVILEGIVYREFVDKLKDQGGHLVKPFKIPASWPKWRVIDYGASAPTACSWMTLAPDETAYCYREYYEKNLSVALNARAIRELSGDEEYVATLMDPHAVDRPPVTYGAAKTVAEQYADAGIPSTGWPYVNVMGEHAMVHRVKHRLENRMFFVFDNCINARREFRSWTYKCDKEGKPLAADAYSNENNHLLDTFKGYFGTNPTFTQTKFKVGGAA